MCASLALCGYSGATFVRSAGALMLPPTRTGSGGGGTDRPSVEPVPPVTPPGMPVIAPPTAPTDSVTGGGSVVVTAVVVGSGVIVGCGVGCGVGVAAFG